MGKRINLQQKITLNFVAAIIIPIILSSLLVFGYYEKILQSKINKSMQQVLNQTSTNIENIIDSSVVASNILCMDSQFAESLQNAGSSKIKWEQYVSAMNVYNRLKEVQNATLHNYNAKISIIDLYGNFYTDNTLKQDVEAYKELKESDWYNQIVELNGFVLWDRPKQQDAAGLLWDPGCVTMSRLIKGNRTTGKYGILIITIPEGILRKVLCGNEMGEDGLVALLDENNLLLGISSKESPYSVLQSEDFLERLEQNELPEVYQDGKEKFIVNYCNIVRASWKVVSIIPQSIIMREAYQLEKATHLFYFVILLVFAMLTIYLSRNITFPIKQLERAMVGLQEGDFTTRVKIGGCTEIESLGKSFNTTVIQVDKLIKQVQEKTTKCQQARLEALQAQIRPHFLINTLNNIRWMATISGNENVALMISNLGKILEGSIYATNENITLEEELDYLKAYVELQKMRFGNQFTIKYDISREIMDCVLPKFIMQPIVENAIIYGTGNRMDGMIQIKGWADSQFLILEISDNGPGIPNEKLQNILVSDDGKAGKMSGIGLPNVNERLKLVYGLPCGLEIESKQGLGTVVRVLCRLERRKSIVEGFDCR